MQSCPPLKSWIKPIPPYRWYMFLPRGLYRLAHGLIEKCFEHFYTSSKVSFELLKTDGTEVKFGCSAGWKIRRLNY